MIHEAPEAGNADALTAAARRLQARATALRQDRPGYTDPLSDALWEKCRHAEDHGFIYDDPRAIAVIVLEHIAGDLARDCTRQASVEVEGVEG